MLKETALVFRYCDFAQTWHYSWRNVATRMSFVKSNRILPRTCDYVGPLCEEANEYHFERDHDG